MFKGLASFIQMFLDAIVAVLNAICLLFPPSPFDVLEDFGAGVANLVAQINYFLPVYEFVAIGELWLVAVGLYYAISVVARWIKAIE